MICPIQVFLENKWHTYWLSPYLIQADFKYKHALSRIMIDQVDQLTPILNQFVISWYINFMKLAIHDPLDNGVDAFVGDTTIRYIKKG
jgi:hypothetical protein